MGKKRVVEKSEEDLIKERETIEKGLKKGVSESISKKQVKRGKVFISSTYNNTIITLTDEKGNALFWKSAGSIGFKGTKKGTSYAASKVAQAIADICLKLKIRELDVVVKGVGGGRSTAIKTLANRELEINSIEDVTPVPHNGPQPPKPRRV